MPTDLHELLEAAAAPPPAFDADAVVDRGLRRRRVRTWTWSGAAVVGLAVVAGVVILSPPQPHVVDLAGRPSAPSWPLALRYEDVLSESGNERTIISEFAANGWDDWIDATRDADDVLYVTRWGPDGRYGFGEVPVPANSAPFSWLAAASEAPLTPDDSESASDGLSPGALFNRRFGEYPEPRDDRVILDDDLTDLRQTVAEQLDLDVDALESVRYEHDSCADDCGVQRHTYVWLPALALPLYVEEIDPTGDRFVMRVTHLREGLAPAPSTLPTPPPVPPETPDDPGVVQGLDYRPQGQEFRIETGTDFILQMRNTRAEPTVTPGTFAVQRWNGDQWVNAGTVSVQGPRQVEPGKVRTVRIDLPDEAAFAWHRVVVSDDGFTPVDLGHFRYGGDPNS